MSRFRAPPQIWLFAESDALHALCGEAGLGSDQMLALRRSWKPFGAVSGSDALSERGIAEHRAPVAQWIEHLTSDQKGEGSNPPGRATHSSGLTETDTRRGVKRPRSPSDVAGDSRSVRCPFRRPG
jgi:hypothetical protein